MEYVPLYSTELLSFTLTGAPIISERNELGSELVLLAPFSMISAKFLGSNEIQRKMFKLDFSKGSE